MGKNEYLCNVNKAEEQQFAVLSSRVSSAEREKHEAQKKARLLEQQNSVLESEKADMQRQLNEKIGEVAETVKQMAQFMMGKGPVTLSDSLRDAIVAGVKEEFEAKLREEREAHSKEMQSLKDQFALMLAAKDNEIAAFPRLGMVKIKVIPMVQLIPGGLSLREWLPKTASSSWSSRRINMP